MTPALRRPPLCAALLLGSLSCAGAAWSSHIDTEPGSGIGIRIALAFENFPRAGYMPCRITIENGSAQPHVWEASFVTTAGHEHQENLDRSLPVAAGQSAAFDLLIPISPSNRGESFYRPPSVDLSGPGVTASTLSLPNSNRSGRTETPFVAMSPQLAPRSWGPLVSELSKHHGAELSGSEINLDVLGEDWRGLLGVGAFFLSTDEYVSLRPGSRQALRTWVVQGGDLILCGRGEIRDFALAGELTPQGLGTVRRLDWDGSAELDVGRAARWILDLETPLGDLLQENTPRWKRAESVGPAAQNVAFLSIFIAVFAATVGPLNLFWFAGAARRHRLFWTTPLISLGASLLLGAVILLQDGFGGRGLRLTLRYLLPAEKQAIVLQEQASRTGLLLARDFTMEEGTFLAPMSLPSAVAGWKAPRVFAQDQHVYGGDWFLSRSVQAQFAQAIVPSRESVELVSAAGAPPEVRSALPVVLREFQYLDPQGNRWRAENLRTGERVRLVPAGGKDEVAAVMNGAGPVLRQAWARVAEIRGHFSALAERAPGLATLPSIRWADETTIYTGAVTPAP